MAFGNNVQVVGNVTRDPELRYTPSGASVTNFSIAWNRRYERNGQQVEDVNFFDIVCWGTLADNVAASITKGVRVIVEGRLDQRSWETPQGEKRSKIEITADEVSPSLRWASVEVARNPRDDNFGGGGGGGGNFSGGGGAPMQNQPPQQAAPAAAPAPQQDYNYDEEPF
ncbi:single-stranded DNA-binding protein [bacterium]|jgi:single-strand DNA-binding protein|nr:single-stranded DNA-binding protein [Acidimicrobiaceae bacterium]MCH9805914.1 single-stranded DNA-binding protein [bacterium]MDB4818424.1 single-stranded DNA-binding protein [Acidimicrobiales bacterium]HAY69257.1 single-stranded DNA-binding protein [Acidimicrobiaceae bacterium]